MVILARSSIWNIRDQATNQSPKLTMLNQKINPIHQQLTWRTRRNQLPLNRITITTYHWIQSSKQKRPMLICRNTQKDLEEERVRKTILLKAQLDIDSD